MTLSILVAMGLPCGSYSAAKNYAAFAAKLDKTVYSGELGAIYTKEYTKFRVWAPTADLVKLKLYSSGTTKKYFNEVTMTFHKEIGVWATSVKGDLKNRYYTFEIKHGKKTYETYDIYAKACGLNGKRSMVVDLDSTDPKGWENDSHVLVDKQTDARIWEVQVADFSSSESSGVSKEHRGKFLAFTETGTTVNSVAGAQSTCVDYLKELGVNYVQINPFYDFGSVDESDISDNDKNYNWGYDPMNYNCPEGSYSSDPKNGAVRITECKQMIQALHNAGIGVIMDVVYNHTHEWEKSAFNLTVPNYYYRMNPDGTYSNGSGCGNDTASEHKMFRKFMIDSVTYWAEEYHIDGFRFDLMGLHDVETMNAVRRSLDSLENGTKLIMYGEAWNLATTADEGTVLATQSNVRKLSDRIGAFDDTFRDAIKGSTGGVDQGFVQSGSNKGDLRIGISGQADETMGWANVPSQCVTYASCHDNMTLWDKLVKSVKGNDGKYDKRYNDLIEMNKLTAAVTFTSQGIPFILAGEELCRTKEGDTNSYQSGFKLNQIDWTRLQSYGDVSDYYKGLIELRKAIPAFSDATSATANSINWLENMPDGVLAYTIDDSVYGKIAVLFNSSDNAQTAAVEGKWVQLVNALTAGLDNLDNISGKVKLPAKSAAVLVDKEKYDALGNKQTSGKVMVRYKSEGEVFASYIVSGKIGESFEISPLQSVLMDYNIKKKSGTSGEFGSVLRYCDFECEKYDGSFSNVTFEFIDGETEKNIAPSILMTNRQEQPYQTAEIPSVSGYGLNMEKLPKNGCGVFGAKDKTVTYRYTKLTKDDTSTKVNIIYMSTDGKILGTDTLTGELGSEYNTTQLEIEGYEFVSVTKNSLGGYDSVEQNVLYIYEPVSIWAAVRNVILISILVLAAAAFIIVYRRRQKKELMKKLDIK